MRRDRHHWQPGRRDARRAFGGTRPCLKAQLVVRARTSHHLLIFELDVSFDRLTFFCRDTLIKTMNSRAVLLTTHSMEEAEALCVLTPTHRRSSLPRSACADTHAPPVHNGLRIDLLFGPFVYICCLQVHAHRDHGQGPTRGAGHAAAPQAKVRQRVRAHLAAAHVGRRFTRRPGSRRRAHCVCAGRLPRRGARFRERRPLDLPRAQRVGARWDCFCR